MVNTRRTTMERKIYAKELIMILMMILVMITILMAILMMTWALAVYPGPASTEGSSA